MAPAPASILPSSTPPPEIRSPPPEGLPAERAAAPLASRTGQAERQEPEKPQPEPARHESAPAPAIDLSGLERQLRQITSQIEALRPASDLEKAIEGIRADLTEIGHSLTEALPRRAVESLEIEVKALAQRIDHSRQCGLDATALAGLERGVTDVRERCAGSPPPRAWSASTRRCRRWRRKSTRSRPRTIRRRCSSSRRAIGGLRGIVSHVASNDTLTKVAEDVRTLSAKVDDLANSAASGHAVSALESRIDTLTSALNASTGAGQAVTALESRIDTLASALNASTEAGHAVPRELEKLLAGLIEKLEWVQLTHTDHAALAHLEDRIAMLVKRFDASDARFVHLEAVERGLADLLVHIEQIARDQRQAGRPGRGRAKIGVGAIERDVAEIKQTERRTQESLEAVQGTVEHVVDRLAMIESDMRDATRRAPFDRDRAGEDAGARLPQPPAVPRLNRPRQRRRNPPRRGNRSIPTCRPIIRSNPARQAARGSHPRPIGSPHRKPRSARSRRLFPTRRRQTRFHRRCTPCRAGGRGHRARTSTGRQGRPPANRCRRR